MAKQPPRDPTASRRRQGGNSLSGDPFTRNLNIMVDMMKDEPVPDEIEQLMAELAKKLDEKSDGGGNA